MLLRDKMKERVGDTQFVKKNQKTCKNMQTRAKKGAKVKKIKKHASQGFLDPIQKSALSRSVQLEVVYLETLLYFCDICQIKMTD